MNEFKEDISVSKGMVAISPIIVFLLVYLLTSILIGDFYKMPISVALLIASVWAGVFMKGSLSEKIEIFSKQAGSSNIMRKDS